jgi:hypothetical protein
VKLERAKITIQANTLSSARNEIAIRFEGAPSESWDGGSLLSAALSGEEMEVDIFVKKIKEEPEATEAEQE